MEGRTLDAATAAAAEKIQRLRDNLPHYAATCLKIRDKHDQVVPFVFNRAQEIVHEALETQKAEKGWVRALVLKARKQGVSTYVQGRNYHRTTLWKNKVSYILAHEQGASDAIFDIVDRFQKFNPVAPRVGTSNVKEMSFIRLDSTYVVATAGSKGTGRGSTISNFHGSEVAFWPNASAHFKASIQAVPMSPGTEIILESTANGPSGEFWERWQEAVAGRGDYVAIFIPWFASPEYAREPEEGFELNPEADEGEISEAEYAEAFGLTLAQMCWRRYKIYELGSIAAFRQEYPATADEAFVSADQRSYIDPLSVLRARKRSVKTGGPLIMGVDPAGGGGDRFAVSFRRGQRLEKVLHKDKLDTQEALAWLLGLIEDEKPDKVFVDSGGLGAPIISLLKSKSPRHAQLVVGVNFGSKSQAKNARPGVAGPKNRRAEMWMRSREWLRDTENPADIPDRDDLQADATSVWVKNDLNNDLQLSTKEEMKAKGIRSPDLWDSVVLTFAESVWVSPGALRATPANASDTRPLEQGSAPSYGYSTPPFRGTGGPSGWMR